MENIISANSVSDKSPYFSGTSLEIEKLRIFLRLAKDLSFLSFKRYELLSARLDEIGRMLGGWIKSV